MVRTSKPRPIRTRFISEKGDFSPIATINTTPLIDMMLVILIMVIVAIPMANHKVPVDLPIEGPQRAPPPFHVLAIDAGGALAWDGQALPAAALPARLAALHADPARPVLHLAAAGEARYEGVDQVMAEVARAGVTRLGFIGNQEFAASFDR
ncbi:MAG: biopolymer transport protein ExbD [Sphingomonadales bacterium]|jgi:biopolymer transport protein ExbD|nr:biopolymer transport protein ExbD [Sphingomonadales bacterium]